MTSEKAKPLLPTIKANEEKWGKTNIKAGWTAIPNALLIHQATIGLTPMDINIIIQIARSWWVANNHPFPSKKTLADSIGVTPRTIQKRIASMEKLGFIKRIQRRDPKGSKSNIYKLTPLKKIMKPYSTDIINEKNRRKEEDKKRPNLRGKPKKLTGDNNE
jgi:DNA replication protein DnaD